MSDGHKTKRIKRSRREKGGTCDHGTALLGRRSTHFPFLIRSHLPNTSPPVSLNFTGDASRQTLFLSSEETGTHRTPHGLRVDSRSTDSHLCEQERLKFVMAWGRVRRGAGGERFRVLPQERLKFNWWGSLSLGEAVSDDELWAAVRLRVRTFYKFNESFGIDVRIINKQLNLLDLLIYEML
ncbi:hypothetical protein ZIOFF_034576 [Zingiber officinale]|uniref:Uncharacterized protein n=1 Tax=Zingiber officinale TaxID=94328 RepID=A0A8J5GST9_ZINOF|nr:hypothetical protein ZIOFF_034576 [Zingiber officinale]